VLAVGVLLAGTAVQPSYSEAKAASKKTVPYQDPPPPTQPNPPYPRPQGKLVPAQGALFGIHTTPDSPTAKTAADMGITAYEADFGRKFDVDNHYYTWDQNFPTWRDRWDIAEGRIPMISWGGTDTRDVANGKHDNLFSQRADAIKALGAPVFLRWFWEADGVRPSKSKTSRSPKDYIAAWRHLYGLFQSRGVTNAVWVWCPVSLNFYPPPRGLNPAQPYYPGDDVVDWICADGYNWAPGKPGTEYQPFQDIFQAFYDFGIAHGKPLMIGETGVQENNPGDKAKWLSAAHVSVIQHYPAIEAFLYFDVDNANAHNYDWRLSTSNAAMAAFKDMALDPYFNQAHVGLGP
jgi:hypothetical protein